MANEFERRAKAAGFSPGVVDANMEGYPLPSMMDTDEVIDLIERTDDYCVLRMIRDLERENLGRTEVIEAVSEYV